MLSVDVTVVTRPIQAQKTKDGPEGGVLWDLANQSQGNEQPRTWVIFFLKPCRAHQSGKSDKK
jgi:hypothetical protein